MKHSFAVSGRIFLAPAVLFFLVLELSFVPAAFCSEEPAVPRSLPAFKPGEVLQYEVSWSRIVAGKVVMTVQQKKLDDGKPVFSFVLAGESSGLLDRLYPIKDVLQSVFDPESMQSLSYTSTERFGKRERDGAVWSLTMTKTK